MTGGDGSVTSGAKCKKIRKKVKFRGCHCKGNPAMLSLPQHSSSIPGGVLNGIQPELKQKNYAHIGSFFLFGNIFCVVVCDFFRIFSGEMV